MGAEEGKTAVKGGEEIFYRFNTAHRWRPDFRGRRRAVLRIKILVRWEAQVEP